MPGTLLTYFTRFLAHRVAIVSFKITNNKPARQPVGKFQFGKYDPEESVQNCNRRFDPEPSGLIYWILSPDLLGM